MAFKRIIKRPEQSFFLLGPRGTGKSTWLREHFSNAHWVDLLNESLFQRLVARPETFVDQLRSLPKDKWVVVDEVQRLPNLLNEVHRSIESEGRRFVLCGSSARKLYRAGVNLLAGRALIKHMHPFVPEEVKGAFHLEDVFSTGMLPVVWGSTDRIASLEAYTQLYLQAEIQAEALVRNLSGFARFLPVAALLHGQTLNASNVSREAGVARNTVGDYLTILEETLLCFRVPAFEAKLRLRERRSPKWYWCDPGLVRAMKQRLGPVTPEERGALFEGMVAQTLRAYRDYEGAYDRMGYWQPASAVGTEVDFVLTRGEAKVAVEVKSGESFHDSWCRGLRAIRELGGLTRRILVYPDGPELRLADGIEVMPYLRFVELLATRTLWPTGS